MKTLQAIAGKDLLRKANDKRKDRLIINVDRWTDQERYE